MPETDKSLAIDKVRELQRKLWVCAKRSKTRRFHALYDRIWRSDVLRAAWERVRSNRGAAGVDKQTLADIEAMGVEKFIAAAEAADIDGVIVVDYPPEECGEFAALAKKHGIDPVFLLAPTSTDRRVEQVARVGSGYLYYVSLRGITGASHIDLGEVAARIGGDARPSQAVG